MKKITAILLTIIFLFSACSPKEKEILNLEEKNEVIAPFSDTVEEKGVTPPDSTAGPLSYVETLARKQAEEWGLVGLAPDEAIKTAYEKTITSFYFSDPVGLDCWRYLSGETEAIPFTENRSLSPLLFGIASCEDFSAVMVMVLESVGIEAQYVAGFTLSVDQIYIDHAWLIVRLDGNWYHLDPQLEQNVVRNGQLRYRFFMKTDAEMLPDHKWGENLIEYFSSMQEEEKKQVLTSYLYPTCNTEYPALSPKEILLPSAPNMLELEAEVRSMRKEPLLPIYLNIDPTVLVKSHHITPLLLPEYYTDSPPQGNSWEYYGRQNLSVVQGRFYDYLLTIMEKASEPAVIKIPFGIAEADGAKALTAFYDDHPEYYWAELTPLNAPDYGSLNLAFKGGLTGADIASRDDRLKTKAAEVLSRASGGDDFSKALAFHDYLADAMYDSGFKIDGSDNAFGSIIEKVAYCNGYARGFQYLCNYAGLQSIYIRGRDLKGTTHAWNGVMLDGNWYYVDVTWDRESNSYGGAYHDFFAITLEESLRERVWDNSQYSSLPESSSNDNNFYTKNGYMLYPENSKSITDDIAEIALKQLEIKTNLKEDYSYSFVEFRIIGEHDDYLALKKTITKDLFPILAKAENLAVEQNLPFSISHNTEVSCYFNDSMQIVAFYPKVKQV